MRGVWLGDLTWVQARERLRDGTVVLVPVGAAAKAHGLHLPLDTDAVLARALAEGVARELDVLIAPVVGFGYYPAFVRYPGSQSLGDRTFVDLVADLLGGLVDDGARHVAVINTGVSTEGPLALAARAVLERTGVQVATAHMRTLGRDADRLLEQREGGHADERETSLMLAVDPGRVHMARAVADYGHGPGRPAPVFHRPVILDPDPANGPDWSATGAVGDPTLATAAKGEAILAAMLGELVRGLREAFPRARGMAG